ncbi:hypothetical protein BAZSYMB_SCAFFOLD00011_8 [Bathymodiolus azoricus thioautotrophic gill symbiont]|nr:hypothetical protein BAZSYMB_SCAFFOLD00011_8 [Bathymodiolus azoricus thioautotrophic gill symbiont]
MHGYECVSYQNTQLINKQKRENPFAILEQLKTTKE